MSNVLLGLVFFVAGEIVLDIIFFFITKAFYKKGINGRSILKGALERIFLVIALVNNYPHALTLFSALKLGTRLKHEDTDKATTNENYNDYYLMGNLISVLAAIGYVYLYSKLPVMATHIFGGR